MDERVTSADLVLRIQRGDRRALGALYRAHRARLYGYLTRAAADPAAADDLFQEVWLKIMQKIDSFDPGKGSFLSWAMRIASNAVIDRARYEGIRRGPELDAPLDDAAGARRIDLVAGEEAGPERHAESSEARAALDRALGRLPQRQRTAVLLRHQQGLSYRELAAALGVPEGTAKALVHRGVTGLRASLEEHLR